MFVQPRFLSRTVVPGKHKKKQARVSTHLSVVLSDCPLPIRPAPPEWKRAVLSDSAILIEFMYHKIVDVFRLLPSELPLNSRPSCLVSP